MSRKIIIPMAGKGSRFKQEGYEVPKYLVEVGGKTLFEWSMESLRAFYSDSFIFIMHGNDIEFFARLRDIIEELGIEDYNIIGIHDYTSGQGDTVALAEPLMESEDSVVIFNIDTHVTPGKMKPEDLRGDGFVYTFRTDFTDVQISESAYSPYSHVVSTCGKVSDAKEKVAISNEATVGLYYFKEWSAFLFLLSKHADTLIRLYGETYIAPLYSYLLNDGTVFSKNIDIKDLHVLGTPTDVINSRLGDYNDNIRI